LKLRATVAYDGTDFHGFQRQANARSVQKELEEALSLICEETIRISGAGRTDTGVHATGQVIAFEANWSHTLAELQRAVNVRLPRDIAMGNLTECATGFHPRFSALSRTYEYTIRITSTRQPMLRQYAWQIEDKLDLNMMNEASGLLIGEHDFAAYGTAPQGDGTIRRILQAVWHEFVASDLPVYPAIRFTIEANAFLFRMARRIVMVLVRVGRGQLSLDEFGDILASRDSQRIRGLAPACGLCLVKVTY
jgi:tRNA pseudouridine38-40 synthase